MKKLLAILAVLLLGFLAGRLSHHQPANAEGAGVGAVVPVPARCQDVNGDGRADVSDAVYLLRWLFASGPEPECPVSNGLPDTGQTTCYDEAGAEIPCDSATYPGQDGFHETGCSAEGRFVDNGDGTVTDTCTGLMWQQDTADMDDSGVIDYNNDRVPYNDALAYCEALELAGHDDWRLPNVRELQSIVDYGRVHPAIDPVFGAFSSPYWSSTSNAIAPDVVWLVDFGFGLVQSYDKGLFYPVRPVRTAE